MDETNDMMARAAALPSEIAPPRDLWPGIESALETQKNDRWQWRVAASVIATSALIGILLLPPKEDKSPGLAYIPTQVPTLDAQLVRHMPFDDSYILDYREALAALDDQLAALPEGTREVVVANLKIVRASIADINQAIDNDPGNVQLRQLLQLAYRQEMAIISMVRDSVTNAEQIRTSI
ncbi:MAG: hypothetical protein AAAFM81_08285 [Pseudomonadota bacterium]